MSAARPSKGSASRTSSDARGRRSAMSLRVALAAAALLLAAHRASAAAAGGGGAPPPPPAATAAAPAGTFVGLLANGTQRWLGVPYAEPPVGGRRWKPPVPKVSGRRHNPYLSL